MEHPTVSVAFVPEGSVLERAMALQDACAVLSARVDGILLALPGPLARGDLEAVLGQLAGTVGASDDVSTRRFTIGGAQGRPAALLYIESLVNKKQLEEHVLEKLLYGAGGADDLHALAERDLSALGVREVDRPERLAQELLAGSAVLVAQGFTRGLVFQVQGWPTRAISTPKRERSIKGPQEGFSETLEVNLSQLRRRIRDPDLRVCLFTLGERSSTDVALLYIQGLSNPRVIADLQAKLQLIKVDRMLATQQLEELLTEERWAPFPLMKSTDRPDLAAQALLDGQVVLLTETTPIALLAPTTFVDTMKASEDLYQMPLVSLYLRTFRCFGLLVVFLLPGLYISITTMNAGLLHSSLAMSIAASREGVPFPPFLEVITMDVMLEMLNEATIRLPSQVGSAATVVGGLIIGEAAARARLVSDIMVVVVASTAISSFLFPVYEQSLAWRMSKYCIIAFTTLFGFWGMSMGVFLFLVHMSSVESFGVPYLTPWVPFDWEGIKRDTVLRTPWFWLQERARHLHPLQLRLRRPPGGDR
ncbi:MAG: spore germination protein [Thermaerobacter sp.]|nr:spore germination protein [Thermaerobacter sp.]